MLDCIIRNARVIDGTGAPWHRGDIGVAGGKVAMIGNLSGMTGKVEYDAHDHYLAPGFIDIHAHSDETLWAYPKAESRILQGVTTDIGGNCGTSPCPINPRYLSDLRTELGEDMPIEWDDMKGFLRFLEEKTISTNFGCLVGHGTLRCAVKGYSPEKLTSKEMGKLKELAAQALYDGAFGLTSGLIYPPGSFSDSSEMIEVLEAVRECGGYYATHMRNESSQLIESVREALQVARAAGVPLQISHHKSLCKKLWRTAVKETTAMIEQARTEGLDVMCDQYPYNASSTGISSNLPGWAFEGGFDEFLTRIHTPDVRARMISQADQSHLGRWQDIHVAYVKSEKNQWMLGQNVVELGKTLGKTPADVVIDLVEEERNCVNEVDFGMCEEDIEYIMQKPYVAICSDGQALSLEAVGQPHPRHFGAFTRVLSHYSRDRGLFPLETAVQKMTSLPASRIGLQDRGLLRIGMWADMVQFDLAVLDSAPTYSAPKQASPGIERVFVNGVLTAENGKHLGVRAGHILRSH